MTHDQSLQAAAREAAQSIIDAGWAAGGGERYEAESVLTRLIAAVFLPYVQALHERLAASEARAQKAEQERDMAIAHDRQPYPTAEAYELACAAREKYRKRAEAAEQARDAAQQQLRDIESTLSKTYTDLLAAQQRVSALHHGLVAITRDLDAAHALLSRIHGWDVLDTTADGAFWRNEIDGILAPAAPPESGKEPSE